MNNILIINGTDRKRSQETASNLTREGFQVATCSDCGEVSFQTSALQADLIIIDKPLPIDSFEICSRLRQTVDVPIIILGQVTDATAWPEAVRSGADLYLEKPFCNSELVARLRAILRRVKWNLDQRPIVAEKEVE